MKNYSVRRYKASDFEAWNAFVARSKNATFLFRREFMEYHSDRYDDFSLMVFDDAKLRAIIPAHIKNATLISHGGLTYGAIAIDETVKLPAFLTLFESVLKFLNENNIERLQIKLLPSIYHQKPSDEIDYALFLADGKLTRRDVLSVLDLRLPIKFGSNRQEGINRGKNAALSVVEEANFEIFWNQVLIPNLSDKHNAKPVHSLTEIELLHERFPKNIRQFNVYKDDKIVAGTTIFESDNVAHVQYIASDENRSILGSVDFLFDHLILNVFKDKRYFDFGISNEENGLKLNGGLLFWKESFGARTIASDFYEVQTANYSRFKEVLI